MKGKVSEECIALRYASTCEALQCYHKDTLWSAFSFQADTGDIVMHAMVMTSTIQCANLCLKTVLRAPAALHAVQVEAQGTYTEHSNDKVWFILPAKCWNFVQIDSLGP